MDDQPWAARGNCRQDPDLFFPADEERGYAARRRVELAKALCASCPVRRECLTYALKTRQRHGVWGGLTDEERHDLTRGRTGPNPKAVRRWAADAGVPCAPHGAISRSVLDQYTAANPAKGTP